MTKITRSVRSTIQSIVADSNSYDADTLQISRNGLVTACKDADKTFAGNDTRRYLVGDVDQLLADRSEGFR